MVDKLAQVYLKNGAATWLLIHIEVQGRPPRGFNERMYIYHYRIFDRYRVPVMSLAVVFNTGQRARFGHYEAGFSTAA